VIYKGQDPHHRGGLRSPQSDDTGDGSGPHIQRLGRTGRNLARSGGSRPASGIPRTRRRLQRRDPKAGERM